MNHSASDIGFSAIRPTGVVRNRGQTGEEFATELKFITIGVTHSSGMAGKQQTGSRERSARIVELAERDPQAALSHLSELPELLVADDPDTRLNATGTLVELANHAPLELRSTSEAILARLDDTHPLVRGNVLLTIATLSQWYPQDFGDGSDLVVESLSSDTEAERVAAAAAVTQLAYYRPDLVTPREQALQRLRTVRERDNLDEHESYVAPAEQLDGALKALEGGDMASRPLEDDLVPMGKRAPLSKPARVGLNAILWFPLAVASVFLWFWRFIKVLWRINRIRPTPAGRLALLSKTTIGYVTHLTLLYPFARARLYVRRSPVATATRLLPGGTTPKTAKPTADVPPYPEDWATLATLVRQHDGHQCRNCGAVGGPRDGDAELHVDHQVPRSRGGPDDPINLRTLCRGCHEARHGRKFD